MCDLKILCSSFDMSNNVSILIIECFGNISGKDMIHIHW